MLQDVTHDICHSNSEMAYMSRSPSMFYALGSFKSFQTLIDCSLSGPINFTNILQIGYLIHIMAIISIYFVFLYLDPYHLLASGVTWHVSRGNKTWHLTLQILCILVYSVDHLQVWDKHMTWLSHISACYLSVRWNYVLCNSPCGQENSF